MANLRHFSSSLFICLFGNVLQKPCRRHTNYPTMSFIMRPPKMMPNIDVICINEPLI